MSTAATSAPSVLIIDDEQGILDAVRILLKGEGFEVGSADAPAGEFTMELRKELTDIQYGRVEDTHGWMTRLDG